MVEHRPHVTSTAAFICLTWVLAVYGRITAR
jgi:hypothetical protein